MQLDNPSMEFVALKDSDFLQFEASSNTSKLPERSRDDILRMYYAAFHLRHPILPSRQQLETYLDSAPELFSAISVIVNIMFAPRMLETEEMTKLVHDSKELWQSSPNDLFKLQASLLLAFASYASTDVASAIQMRTWCSNTIFKALTEISKKKEGCMDFLASWRTKVFDNMVFMDILAKIAHEVYFLDVVFAVLYRAEFSEFVNSGLIDKVPVQNLPNFSLKCRFRTLNMVHSLISSLETFGTGFVRQLSDTDFKRLENCVTAFQEHLTESVREAQMAALDRFPAMTCQNDDVDDGIQQSIMILNFSVLLVHFPVSSLARSTPPFPGFLLHNPNPGDRCGFEQGHESARQCINAANNIVQIVPALGCQRAPMRTPFYSIVLAVAVLVHLRMYGWLSTRDELTESQQQELRLYDTYIRLEVNVLQMCSKTWAYAKTLYNSVCVLLKEELPELSKELLFDAEDLLPLDDASGMDQVQMNTPQESLPEFTNELSDLSKLLE